jgi:hypothetical protein
MIFSKKIRKCDSEGSEKEITIEKWDVNQKGRKKNKSKRVVKM